MMILQKVGRVTPSIAATLIEGLPDEGDPKRPIEEKIAQNVAALAYVGLWSCKWTVIMNCRLSIYLPSISRR